MSFLREEWGEREHGPESGHGGAGRGLWRPGGRATLPVGVTLYPIEVRERLIAATPSVLIAG